MRRSQGETKDAQFFSVSGGVSSLNFVRRAGKFIGSLNIQLPVVIIGTQSSYKAKSSCISMILISQQFQKYTRETHLAGPECDVSNILVLVAEASHDNRQYVFDIIAELASATSSNTKAERQEAQKPMYALAHAYAGMRMQWQQLREEHALTLLYVECHQHLGKSLRCATTFHAALRVLRGGKIKKRWSTDVVRKNSQ